MSAKEEMKVEKDPEKLFTHCCGLNIMKDGDDPPLIAMAECPDWLFEMDISQKKIELSDLDPESDKYWYRLRNLAKARKALLYKSNIYAPRDPKVLAEEYKAQKEAGK